MKKKLLALVLSGIMALSVTGCAGSGSESGTSNGGAMQAVQNAAASTDSTADALPTVNWKISSTWGNGDSFYNELNLRLVDLVSTMTGGKFVITSYAAGDLCGATQMMEYVEAGTLDGATDWPGYWSGRDTVFEYMANTMDWMSGMDMYLWLREAGGTEAVQEVYGTYGLHYLPMLVTNAESGIRSNVPITSLDDMRDLKIRMGGVLAGKVAEKLGFNATVVAASELYESLQRGVVDACEYSSPYTDQMAKLYEVTQYVTSPAWYHSAGFNGIMINQDSWDALPTEYQEVFEIACSTIFGENLAKYAWGDAVATQEMDAYGIEHLEMNAEDVQLLRDTVEEVCAEEVASNPKSALIYESRKAYMDTIDPYRELLGDYGFGFTKD